MAVNEMRNFHQFSYCKLCKKNTSEGKTHIYSKKHRDSLKEILDRFRSKITAAKVKLTNPSVHDEEWEMDKKFWCYFCDAEINLHQKDNDLSIENGGMFLHLVSKDHHINIKKYWKENRLDYSLQNEFRLSLDDYQRFLEALPEEKSKFLNLMDRLQQKEIQDIKKIEQLRKEVAESARSELMQSQPSCSSEDGFASSSFQNHQTVYAFGEGLTRIEVPKNKSKGNIFTGAIPPWLQKDTGETTEVIGPTMEDFNKFKESERKKKLPKDRVGANFNHSGASSADWLPSFGRVWNSGRRWQSRHEYRKERKQKKLLKKNSKTSTQGTSSNLSNPQQDSGLQE